LKANEFFFRLKKPLLFSLLALFFILVGIFLASGLRRADPSTGGIQATASSTNVEVSKAQFLGRTEPPLSEEESPFVKVAEKVSPAVVNISAEKTVKGGYLHEFYPFDDFFRRFFGEVPEGRLPAQKAQSLGSGFIFRKDGYVLTNNHVVSGADNIFVKLPDGSQHKAKVVGLDKDTDIAVLKIDVGGDLPFIELGNSDALKVGEWVMAIGNPFPQLGLDRTVTVGVVSAKGRGNLNFGEDTPNYQNYIQTDASINPGNSGGPLVNIRGEVVGINSAITNPTGMAFNIGIGFAIPINLAESVIPDLIQKGKVSRGYLGIVFQELDKNTADALHLPSTEGVLVRDVQAGTPADKAGIKMRDVITAFNDQKVINGQNFRMMVAQAAPGQEVTIDIVRDGKKITEKLELADREKFLAGTEEQKPAEEEEENWLGLKVTTSTKDLANQYGVKFHPGVMVMEVDNGSLAEQAEFFAGDIIVKINDREIEDLESYQKTVGSLKDQKKAILFLIYRNGEPLFKGVKTE
jgi:serine protease Do